MSPKHNHYAEKSNLDAWNWGAFMFPVIWGIANKSYLALLTIIPFFGLIWRFVCGSQGNRWAYDANTVSPRTIMKLQESWNRVGKVAFILSIATLAAALASILVATKVIIFNT